MVVLIDLLISSYQCHLRMRLKSLSFYYWVVSIYQDKTVHLVNVWVFPFLAVFTMTLVLRFRIEVFVALVHIEYWVLTSTHLFTLFSSDNHLWLFAFRSQSWFQTCSHFSLCWLQTKVYHLPCLMRSLQVFLYRLIWLFSWESLL